jgi:RNA polymerase sigma factor (sigma-70 family)
MRHDKEIHRLIKERFGTNKTHDERFGQYGEVDPVYHEDVVCPDEDTRLSESQKEKLESIKEVSKILPPQQQKVLYYYGVEQMTFKEVAEKLGVEEGTVKGYMQIIKEKIIAYHAEKSTTKEPFDTL